MINTTLGMVDESTLDITEGVVDDDNEYTTWKEYCLDGEIVRRDVHIALKSNVVAQSIAATF